MADKPEPSPLPPPIQLKDPAMAGFLAWLVPGLGHFYQGRYAKGAIFAVSIWGIFLYGIYLGSSREVGIGRVVYCSFRSADLRLYYFCQAGAGLPALPAIIQAIRANNGRAPLLASKFEAPPRDDAELNALNFNLGRDFELGTLYTSIAGLLNLLAAYDACCGPIIAPPGKKEEETDDDVEQ